MTEKKLEDLQETHSEMLATAHDMGIEVPEELRADFSDAGAGASIVAALDALIKEGVVKDDGAGHTAPASQKKPAKKRAPAAKKTKPSEEDAADPVDVDPPTKEKQVAKKAAKTNARKPVAKKAATKKAAKKAGGGGRRTAFADDAKITRTGKDNPAREGSGRYKRIQNVLSHNGKTVKTYRATGKGGTLGWCVKAGLVKVA